MNWAATLCSMYMYEVSSTQCLLRETLRLSIFFTKICFNLQFLCNTITNMITFKSKKQTNCNHLLLYCLIVKLTCILYKNITDGNLVFTEQLLEVGESLWNKFPKKKNKLFRNKHLLWTTTQYWTYLMKCFCDHSVSKYSEK